jgi:hypothetical protein
MSVARRQHSAILLPDGRVLVTGGATRNVGGVSGSSVLASAEVYDPVQNTWNAVGGMSAQRFGHTATLLLDGRVLIAGSANLGTSAEIYDSAQGFQAAWQPQLNPLNAPLFVGQSLSLSGSGWQGYGNASASGGGGSSNSATNYPLVQLYRLDNAQTLWLPASSFSAADLTTQAVSPFNPGPTLLTLYVNGIPSQSRMIGAPVWTAQSYAVFVPLIVH